MLHPTEQRRSGSNLAAEVFCLRRGFIQLTEPVPYQLYEHSHRERLASRYLVPILHHFVYFIVPFCTAKFTPSESGFRFPDRPLVPNVVILMFPFGNQTWHRCWTREDDMMAVFGALGFGHQDGDVLTVVATARPVHRA